MSTISISILLQKNTIWFYLHWTWLEQGIFLTLVERWIERSPQQISSFKLIRDLLSLNMKTFRLKFFGALEAWFVELQGFEVCWSLWRLFQLNSNRTSKNLFECSSCVLETVSPELWRLENLVSKMRGDVLYL